MKYHFFNNRGGVSTEQYASLNIGRSVGDDPILVMQNRGRVKDSFGGGILVSARQVHKDRIYVVENEPAEDIEVDGFDALITACPNIVLMVQLADCQGILLFDPEKSVVAAVHCGWRGSVVGIVEKTVLKMQHCFGSDPGVLQAFISPSLGPCCAEFINFHDELPETFYPFQVRPFFFDFWEISKSQLVKSGLDEGNIAVSGICTCCNSDFFSYRRAVKKGNGSTGRHCAVIRL